MYRWTLANGVVRCHRQEVVVMKEADVNKYKTLLLAKRAGDRRSVART